MEQVSVEKKIWGGLLKNMDTVAESAQAPLDSVHLNR